MFTLGGCKVAIFVSNVFKVTGGWIDDLNITGKILLTPDFTEVCKSLVRNIRDIELVIAFQNVSLSHANELFQLTNGQKIIVNLFEDGIRQDTIW